MMMPIGSVMRVVRIFRVVALIDAEYSFHATNDAADRSADDSADWASDAVAFIKAMSGCAHRVIATTCSN
jgi:hypothetical protein